MNVKTLRNLSIFFAFILSAWIILVIGRPIEPIYPGYGQVNLGNEIIGLVFCLTGCAFGFMHKKKNNAWTIGALISIGLACVLSISILFGLINKT